MESRTERLLRAVGNREAFAVIRALLESEMTTNGLSGSTQLSSSTLERTLEILSQAGVVSRHPGPQGAWFVSHWHETFALLDSARVLGVALQGTEDRLGDEERELFARLESAGEAAAAVKRGGRRTSGEDDGV